jgi:acetate kinase
LTSHTVLCINTGSSSLKTAVFAADGDRLSERARLEQPVRAGALQATLDGSLTEFRDQAMPPPSAVGHRVVHGGATRADPTLIDDRVLDELQQLVPFAPLHLPASIAGIELMQERCPGIPQVACFDTAFHRRMPEAAQRLPLPRELWDAGVRRYGFHGLAYESVVDVLGDDLGERAVLAHLGSGASMTAVVEGVSVDTTMGLTPTGGLVMSTRTGDLDPGVAVHLLREQGFDPDGLERLFDGGSGLLALSGGTGDMKALLERRPTDARAALAIDIFCRQARKHVGALTTVLGGLDTLVFSGGIGERSAPIRAEICDGLEHLGVWLDAERNERDEPVISKTGAACTVRVVQADEELVIARHTAALVGG